MAADATDPRVTIDDVLREARSRLERLSPREALAATTRGGLIVDIRSEVQRARQGLVPDAHFVPRNVLEWRADPACATGPSRAGRQARAGAHCDPVVVGTQGVLVLMCAQGYQSSLAAATLKSMAIRATDMIGGFEAWAADGLPVV